MRIEDKRHGRRIIGAKFDLSSPMSVANKHDKLSTNVTAGRAACATTTTCCSEKLQNDSIIQLHNHPSHRLVRYNASNQTDSDWHSSRSDFSYEQLLSSPSSPSECSPAQFRTGASSAGERHSPKSKPMAKIDETGTNGRVISPLLLMLALVIAHCHCHLVAIKGSVAAPQEHYGGVADSATMRPVDQPAPMETSDPWRLRDLRDVQTGDKLAANASNVFEVIFKKRPYSKYWTVEQKWDDLFKRVMAVQGTIRHMLMKDFLRDIEYYSDLSISAPCESDLKFIQAYVKRSTNFRWLAHMFDSTGKSEPGMLTGMLANLGHPVQCIKVRAPARLSNDSFDEHFFEQQTRELGERFRGKYCLASIRPVMPKKPHLVSRFSRVMNLSMLSNISYTGESARSLKTRTRQMSVPAHDRQPIDRRHLRLDLVPFESELYQYLIDQRNFIFALPRLMGVCYPSSCSRDDIKASLQRTFDDQHQVVDIEFECEQEERSPWDWFNTPRLVAYVLLALLGSLVFLASLTRYILLSKMQIKRSQLHPASGMSHLLDVLDMVSMDKCAGILFIKTKRASPLVDWTKVENNRSTSIDALRGFLILVLIYSQMTLLGCLPLPFMWSKWSDAMFPFFRSAFTQVFINMSLWSEAFYVISAYLIALKCFENFRPKILSNGHGASDSKVPIPSLLPFLIKRYIRLLMPMMAFILLNYVWPRLSNGFVFQDQAGRLMKSCDTFGWTNMMLFHNHHPINETCLWPSHVSATFFQLHLLSYPLLLMCLMSLWVQFNGQYDKEGKLMRRRNLLAKLLTSVTFGTMAAIGLLGAIYSAWQASQEQLIVPFLIDYIDYDNYQRVIEWMVTPTYNHLTSYMMGISLAFIIIRRKARNEQRRLETSAWLSGAAHGDGSASSVLSSSTQELQDGLNFRLQISPGASSSCASSQPGHEDVDSDAKTVASLAHRSNGASLVWRLLVSSCALLALFASLLASWLWNGLGQPMSANQTFWYVLVSKLCFCLTFGYLFLEHFATRRNSNNPWMVTRFLVPIGRMSLTVFYISWLVIWFDLLASLYQWHPSHYFLFEKYTEIIFITLIVAMFVYGLFEGIIRRAQYAGRRKRVERGQECQAQFFATQDGKSSSTNDVGETGRQFALRQQPLAASNRRGVQVKPFESFFDAPDKRMADGANHQAGVKCRQSLAADKAQATVESAVVEATGASHDAGWQRHQPDQHARQSAGESSLSTDSADLTPSYRYEMNAELRANCSFASIGLYENAGATSDLSNLNATAHDPRASPATSQRR